MGTRAPLIVETHPNARWSIGFVDDQLASGRRFRILNVVDDVTRDCLMAVADTSISGARFVSELTVLIERRGRPAMIVPDHGTEFTSNAVLACCRKWSWSGFSKVRILHLHFRDLQPGPDRLPA